MKKRLFILVMIVIIQSLYSQDYKITLSDKSYFYEEKINDTLKLTLINQSYDIAYNEKYDFIIFSQIFKHIHIRGMEGEISNAKVEALINRNGKYEKIWEIGGDYNSGGHNYRDLYILIRTGCCGAVPTKAYYDIITGHQIAESNIDILKVHDTYYDRYKDDIWYISFKMNIIDEYKNEFKDKTDGGILQIYSRKKGVIEKLLFIANDFFCPEIYFTTAENDYPSSNLTFDDKYTYPLYININILSKL